MFAVALRTRKGFGARRGVETSHLFWPCRPCYTPAHFVVFVSRLSCTLYDHPTHSRWLKCCAEKRAHVYARLLNTSQHGSGTTLLGRQRGLLQIEASFEVDANGEKRRLSQFEIDRKVQEATYPDKSDEQKIETKNGWKIYRFIVRSTLMEEKSKDVFESGDKEKLDTFTEMYPDEDEYDNAAGAHDAESANLNVSIEALARAIAALEKGVADSDFQSGVGHAIRKVVMNLVKVSNSDHSNSLSFSSGGASDGGRYGPQSGEIVGILKQLMDETSVDLQTLEKEELDLKTNHWTFLKAKTKEISVLAKTIEEKMVRVETLAVGLRR